MRAKVFYALVALMLLSSVIMAVWGRVQPLTQQQAMTAFWVLLALWIALNYAGMRGRFLLRFVAAIVFLASSMVWLIPAVRTYGLP